MRSLKRALMASIAILVATPSVAGAAAPKSLPIGSCINLGNTLEVDKSYDIRDGMVGPGDFARIRKAGFDTVRIPVRWDERSKSSAPYTVDAAWMKKVQSTVDQAMAAGLKVILNSHHFQPIYKDPLAVQPWHTGVWSQIAERFKDYPTDRLWFELENEPHDKFTDENLRQTLDPALAVVRKTNPDRPVIYGGQMWSGLDSLETLSLPDDPNVYPTFHYYTPFDFTHQGAQWVEPDVPEVGRVYGTQADRDLLKTDVAKVKAYAERTGLMPFMGESGAYEAHIPLDQRIAYTKAVHDAFVPAGVSVCQWAYANTFPFYDRKSGNWLPGMLGALGLTDDAAPAAAAQGGRSSVVDTSKPTSAAQASKNATLAEFQKQLPGQLINDPTSIDWPVQGASMETKVVQDASIPGGGAARQYTVPKKLANPWEAQTTVPLTAGIERGQTATVGFYARTISAETPDGKGTIGVRFQQNAAPYPGFADNTLSIGKDWNWYEVSGVAPRSISKDVAIVTLQLGGAKQVVEIGQTIVIEGAPSIVKTTTTTKAAPNSAMTSELPDPLKGTGQLINDPTNRDWGATGGAGTTEALEESRIWLGRATRFTTKSVGANAWDLGAAIPIESGIKAGDKLMIAIAARTQSAQTADGKARVGIRVQSQTPPYDGFADNTFTVGPNWQLIRINTQATSDFAPGAAQIALHFAGAAQSVDIGPVYVIKTN